MALKSDFQKAAKDVQKLSKRPSDKELLNLYGLYKQATVGDVAGPKPGLLDFKAKAKYQAWSALKGTSEEEAMKNYVASVKKLQAQLG
ncbi:MAG TPA: acyl-CoA-binding protein [bacterium]|nr:acyl-CoA-binding protein [bacterium]